ncbi:MAG TPA: hypothetical protein VN328_11275, partial [Thermodesulfovibrionales bacterium]|nr:hypothetical protein [Thermodesulfovibrionales bacterium]
ATLTDFSSIIDTILLLLHNQPAVRGEYHLNTDALAARRHFETDSERIPRQLPACRQAGLRG